MPAKSPAQWRWLHTEDAKKQLGEMGVSEWEESTPTSLRKNKDEEAPKRKKPWQS